MLSEHLFFKIFLHGGIPPDPLVEVYYACLSVLCTLSVTFHQIMHLSKFCPTYPPASNVGEYEGI